MPPELHFNRLDRWSAVRDSRSVFRRAALAALTSRGERSGEVSYTFVTEDEMRGLNRDYMDRDHPTDVIAFDLGDGQTLLGDVYISPEMAAVNAANHDEAESWEIVRLVVHGSLHVIGLDHPEGPDRESAPMFVLQEELLRSLTDG